MFGRIDLSDECTHVSERSMPKRIDFHLRCMVPFFLILWSVTKVNFIQHVLSHLRTWFRTP